MEEQLDLLLEELLRDEGFRAKMYKDTEGHWTIGIGHNLEKGISLKIAQMLCVEDIAEAVTMLDQRWSTWEEDCDTPVRQRAIINMAFNLGPKLFEFKSMISAIKDKRWDDARKEALNSLWAEQVGERADRIAGMLRAGK